MKPFAIVLLLSSAAPAFTQSPPSPATPPDPLLQAPPLITPGKPQFKFQFPDKAHPFLVLPKTAIPLKPFIKPQIDPGMLRKPQGFAQRPARPAPHADIYPSLKIQPTEIALLAPLSCPDAKPRTEPIPRTFPKAKVEPIPTTWDTYRLLPVTGGGTCNP